MKNKNFLVLLGTFKYAWCSASLSARRDLISETLINKLISSGSFLLKKLFLIHRKILIKIPFEMIVFGS